jgi:hypothetical protein
MLRPPAGGVAYWENPRALTTALSLPKGRPRQHLTTTNGGCGPGLGLGRQGGLAEILHEDIKSS